MTVGYMLVVIVALIAIGFAAPLIENKNYAAPDLKAEYPDCICTGDTARHTVNWSSVFTSFRCCPCNVRWYVWCLV